MRTSANLWTQVVALVVFLALRFSSPGWMLVILIMTGVPLLFAVTPAIAAVVVRGRRVLGPAETAPFLCAAASMVLAGALVAEFGDTEEVRVPILFGQVFGPDDAVVDVLNTAGLLCVACYVVSVAWLLVALAVTARKS
jgi:hypothetical protein